MKDASTIKCVNNSITGSENSDVDSVKTLAHDTVFLWKLAKVFGQRGYKWSYINRSLKSLWLYFALTFIAKLVAYGFYYQSPRIMQSFLSNRQQRTKINNAFSRYSEIIYGVSQGSILCSLFFNTFFCDILFDIIECDITSYADNITKEV